MAFQITRNSTLIQAVNAMAALIGYPTSLDPAGSNDPKMIQMIASINAAASDLITMRDWQVLSRNGQVTVASVEPGQTEIAMPLPEDFGRFVDQTQNNATARLPSHNPMLAREWQAIKTLAPGVNTNLQWRVRGGKLCFLNPTVTPQTLTFEYQSCAWVEDADDSDLFKNIVVKNGDIMLLDPDLIVMAGRVRWLETNGFDSGVAMRDFQRLYDNRIGNDTGAPVLNMSRGGSSALIGYHNIPTMGVAQ
jgi:hypothetical protein